MDSFELNKIAGAVLFALLVFFGTRVLTDILFAAHPPEKPGYEVALPDAAETDEKAAETTQAQPLPVLLAGASADKGERTAKKCSACHTFDAGGPNRIGPNLHGIVGKQLASVEGFNYSEALKTKGGSWGYDELNAFLRSPKGFVPGTKMAFAGIKNDQDRANLILYMRSLGGNPPPLPAPETAAPAATPAAEQDKKAAADPAEQAAEQKPAAGTQAVPEDQQSPPLVPVKPDAPAQTQTQ